MEFDLFTDGSCSAKDRVGGWAFHVPSHSHLDDYGYEYDTTISRMELCAAIFGLAKIGDAHGPVCVRVFSDSEYVVKGITDRTRKRNLNQDLWGLLDELTDSHRRVTYTHVRGHNGNPGNERVDQMARGARNYAILERNND
jgi:ribonuclease HI